MYKTSIW